MKILSKISESLMNGHTFDNDGNRYCQLSFFDLCNNSRQCKRVEYRLNTLRYFSITYAHERRRESNETSSRHVSISTNR